MTLKALVKNLVGVRSWGNVLVVAGEQVLPADYGFWSFCLGGTGKGLHGHNCIVNLFPP